MIIEELCTHVVKIQDVEDLTKLEQDELNDVVLDIMIDKSIMLGYDNLELVKLSIKNENSLNNIY